MSYPVSGKPNIMFYDEAHSFELIKDVIKKEALSELEKASTPIKIALKEQADSCVETALPILTSPVTCPIEAISPKPVTNILNTSVNTCAENVSKKVCHKTVDKCVDQTAKKAIDNVVEKSVDSTQSNFSMAYEYFLGKSS